MIEPMLHEKE